ncbi:PExPT-CTERM protein [Acidobacterium sp. S8]|uniref:PExPT-CTERM protein n=1 Tax=Acidobacterium sp. S8 TaxID=1641854 RepID=UPI001577572E
MSPSSQVKTNIGDIPCKGKRSLFILTTRNAFALIGGCVHSPEDPTVVMALLDAGAAAALFLMSRIRSRRNTK